MKLATINHKDITFVALVEPEQGLFWPVSEAFPNLPDECAADMVSAVTHIARDGLVAKLAGGGSPLSEAKILAPVINPPRNIMCVGKNYTAHALEFTKSGFDSGATSADQAIPKHPIIFTKPFTSITGPDTDVPIANDLGAAIDYEVELAVIIGRGGRAIRREDAMSHVFGYTIINDLTARDLQLQHKQWFLGKCIDGFCPMGPWIVSADEVDELALRVTSKVNGELRQDATTDTLIFDIPKLIETISLSTTLLPGDIIATGTPEGVGIGFNPPRYLKDGDEVECEISGIGVLRNTMRRQTA